MKAPPAFQSVAQATAPPKASYPEAPFPDASQLAKKFRAEGDEEAQDPRFSGKWARWMRTSATSMP
jgi:hypothetical protein